MKKINILNFILFLITLFFTFFYFQIPRIIIGIEYKYYLFFLVTIFSVSMIQSYIVINTEEPTNYYIGKILAAILFGLLSGLIVGSQTGYDRYGHSVGPPVWAGGIGIVYTITFGIFIYSVGKLNNRILSLLFLLAWESTVAITGYGFENSDIDMARMGEDFDSYYTVSSSGAITPTLLIAVGVMMIVLLIKIIRKQ